MNQATTILFVHHGIGLGGAPRSLGYLIAILKEDGYRCVVLMRRRDDESIPFLKHQGAEILYSRLLFDLPVAKHFATPTFLKRLSGLVKIMITFMTVIKFIIKVQPNIVHFNDIVLGYLCPLAKIFHKKVFLHRRAQFSQFAYHSSNLCYLGIKQGCDTIISICSAYQSQKIGNVHDIVIYNPVPLEKFNKAKFAGKLNQLKQSLGINNHSKVLLFIGGADATPHKGGDIFLASFQIIRRTDDNLTALIVGNRTITKPFWKDNVYYTGQIENVEDYYAIADVVIVPFLVDHFARPILEAFAMKIPVIASDLPALSELVIPGETGLLFKPGDIQDLATKIKILLQDVNLQKKITANAYKWVLSAEKESKEMVKLLFKQ